MTTIFRLTIHSKKKHINNISFQGSVLVSKHEKLDNSTLCFRVAELMTSAPVYLEEGRGQTLDQMVINAQVIYNKIPTYPILSTECISLTVFYYFYG